MKYPTYSKQLNSDWRERELELQKEALKKREELRKQWLKEEANTKQKKSL